MYVAKWYTRAGRVRIYIAKFDGRWKIPGGAYTIPELVALLGGGLCTLFLLPRLGQPVLTALFGVGITTAAVGVMRRMPYSPVKFSTRIHRIIRLYTSPISTTAGDRIRFTAAVSVVRPNVAILDADGEPARHGAPHLRRVPVPRSKSQGWGEMFEASRSSAAAELFN
jgi:hypothetical protein